MNRRMESQEEVTRMMIAIMTAMVDLLGMRDERDTPGAAMGGKLIDSGVE